MKGTAKRKPGRGCSESQDMRTSTEGAHCGREAVAQAMPYGHESAYITQVGNGRE